MNWPMINYLEYRVHRVNEMDISWNQDLGAYQNVIKSLLLAKTSLKQGMNTFHHYLLLEKENITNYYSILTNKGLSQIASLGFE